MTLKPIDLATARKILDFSGGDPSLESLAGCHRYRAVLGCHCHCSGAPSNRSVLARPKRRITKRPRAVNEAIGGGSLDV